MLLKYITSKKYSRREDELEVGSVWGGPHNFVSLGTPKGCHLALHMGTFLTNKATALNNVCSVFDTYKIW